MVYLLSTFGYSSLVDWDWDWDWDWDSLGHNVALSLRMHHPCDLDNVFLVAARDYSSNAAEQYARAGGTATEVRPLSAYRAVACRSLVVLQRVREQVY